MKEIFYIQNPEGKAFQDSVSYNRDQCIRAFVASWFAGWQGLYPDTYEANVLWKMFERANFKCIKLDLPKPTTK